MNKDQENYPIVLIFYKSLWYLLFDDPYKFLRDWVIFGRDMLFLMRTFWFVKFKRKIKQWLCRHFLLNFTEIYREHALFGPSQSLKVTSQKIAPFTFYQLQDQIIYRNCYEKISFERLNRIHGFKNQESTKKWENSIFLFSPDG